MLKNIKEIIEKDLYNTIDKANEEIFEIEEEKLQPLSQELRNLRSPDIIRNFNWFQKNITQRRDYQEYIKTAEENKLRIPVLEENIAFIENKIADCKQKVGNSNRKIITNKSANSLDELGINSFEKAINILEENNVNIVLEENDKILSNFPTHFQDMSDFCFIYKSSKLPNGPEFQSKSELKEQIKTESLIGEMFKSLTIQSGEQTIHGTINCIDKNSISNYAVLSPFDKLDKSRLVSAAPENTFFDSSFNIPENSYILVPENELEYILDRKDSYPDINIFGYKGNINNILSILMNNLGYDEQEIRSFGWEDQNKYYNFQKVVQESLEKESEIKISDVLTKIAKSAVENNRFIPYGYTKFVDINSQANKKNNFTASFEYLYESLDEFDVKKKKLKTVNTVEYDQDLLLSDPKDKSEDIPQDIFTNFIDILISRDKEKIDEYLSDIDEKYIPDKEEFREQLLKATSRLKKHRPIRDKFFTNVFERFIDLNLELENTKEDLENQVKETKTEDKTIDITEEKFIKDEASELPGKEETMIDIEEKDQIIASLEQIDEKQIDDDFEILIEPIEEEKSNDNDKELEL